ncbi:HAD family hydrolase [Actinacidiphila acididurans]|uniref:HAD-IA family hydrolase n=1 Tax=Actinacidiphila acididurans TaxID=2784346 RepID=A0ABS2TYW8_9ACTN|nr:HAD-IA family hydrolase [Actinacidiphila acididurans]MBM9507500.1 HAD-IA family hydrolase [Actinacidiphila acididurans]
MTVKGCMVDFSGTLFRMEPAAAWLGAVLAEQGVPATEDEIPGWARRLEEAGAQPGGALPREVPAALAATWRDRDLNAERHRAAYTGLSRTTGLPWDVHDALYARHHDPAAWQPYPDAGQVLGELRARGVPVAVVSNIGWDLRPVFRAHGLDGYVDAFVLSCEHGVMKPDARIFRIACEALGVAPEDAVMVGDSARADGAAAALGSRVLLVDPLPVAQRPYALRGVLDLLG